MARKHILNLCDHLHKQRTHAFSSIECDNFATMNCFSMDFVQMANNKKKRFTEDGKHFGSTGLISKILGTNESTANFIIEVFAYFLFKIYLSHVFNLCCLQF
jgi:hypothetical protein